MSTPNGEKVLSDYLREHPAVEAIAPGRVMGGPPRSNDLPWVKVVQLNAGQAGKSDHLVEFYFQLDCYAGKEGGQPEAIRLGNAVRDAITEFNGTQSDAVVTAGRINGHARIPDEVLTDRDGNARERMIVTASVWMHS